MAFETVSVIGLGYIGLPTAAMFASRKKNVIGVDVNQNAVDIINRGKIHIVEPELDMIVHAAVKEGFLKATLQTEPADAFLIAVPTPFKSFKEGDIPVPDLDYIQAACKAIAPVLKKGGLVILESTSPVGATEQMAKWLAEARVDLTFPQTHGEESDIRIAHCPERVLPGHVVRELVENDRVIGGMTERCSDAAIELYSAFVKGSCIKTNSRTAEMAKLTENSCRDVQIAFANELSIICDQLDIDVWELISLANRHPRINILQPGPGVGGHCIAVDPWFIVSKTPELAKLIHTARNVNSSKPDWVLDKVKIAITEYIYENEVFDPSQITIACYGVAFKANIDDLRESPALEITRNIANFTKAKVLVVEPNIVELPDLETGIGLELVSHHRACKDAHVHILLVDHDEFISRPHLADNSKVIDTKGLWS